MAAALSLVTKGFCMNEIHNELSMNKPQRGFSMRSTHNGLAVHETCNSYGLYDVPIGREARERIVLTLEAMDSRIEQGAFLLDEVEAVQAGFINPYDDDTALVTVR
jgi:hypothetical protein